VPTAPPRGPGAADILGRMDIAVIGGTGEEGFGLCLRLGKAGKHVIIGSRSQEKGAGAAEKARELLGGGEIEGTTNQEAAERADVVIVTVPFAGQADIYRSIKDNVAPGKLVVDCTSPLATAVGGRAWQVVRPWHGSAAEQAKALLDPGVRMVAAFHTVSGEQLQELSKDMESDVFVCGKDAQAKATVGELIDSIPNLRWVDAGDLSMARIVETLTAVMVSVNRAYRIHDAGFRVTGRGSWGPPPAKS
jgi:NADPH-dependent F420 reductase